MDDEPGVAVGSESVEPGREKCMQRLLADADRRIRPDAVEADRRECGDETRFAQGRGAVGFDEDGRHPRGSVLLGVLGAQLHGAFVDVDGPHSHLRCACGERECDGAIATSEVEQLSHRRRGSRCLLQQETGSGVDLIAGEDAGVGGEAQLAIGKGEIDAAPSGRGLRLPGEVLGGVTGHGATLPLGRGSSCHPHHR